MKKLLLSIIALACGMSMNAQTKGTATRTGGIEVNWVQLWADGPKFAEYNVGAENNKATDFGGYYCWGSSVDKDPDALSGSDDTATSLWGSAWRKPTRYEFQALIDNCDVEWTTVNDVNGCKFTGKGEYSGNSIFLPAAGYCISGDVKGQGFTAYYWSSTPDGFYGPFCLSFNSRSKGVGDFGIRSEGYSVRAVLAENNTPTAIEGIADNAISTRRGGKKVIENGQVVILNNGRMYNTVGIEIKK